MFNQIVSGISGIVFERNDTYIDFTAAGFNSVKEFEVRVKTFEEFEYLFDILISEFQDLTEDDVAAAFAKGFANMGNVCLLIVP